MKKILLLIAVFIFSVGVAFGQTFTSVSVSNITQSSAQLNADVNLTNGSGTYYIKYEYKLSTDPPFSWTHLGYSGGLSAGSTYLDSNSLTGLAVSTNYDYRALLLDGSGNTVATSSTASFTTNAAPAATTGSATSVTQTTVQLSGTGNANGNGSFTTGLGYKLTSSPSYTYVTGTPSTISGTASTGFNSGTSITGLTAGTTYDFVAALFDGGGTKIVQGSSVQFTTLAATVPVLTTGALGLISDGSVQVISSTIASDGAAAISGYGLAVSTSKGTYVSTDHHEKGNAFTTPNNFTYTATGLSQSTHYYVVAYALNSVGTTYGITNEHEFYTSPSSRVNLTSITDLTDADHTTLTLNWSDGSGDGRLIVAYLKGGIPSPPVDGTVYTGSPAYGSGTILGSGYVVYSGTGTNSLGITGLDGTNDDYDFYGYEYAGSGAGLINYKQTDPGFLTTDGSTFPIELLSFTAKNDNGNVLINWATASETDNDFFEIERSTDAENFEVIASIPGAGYSNEVLNYSIQDNDALEGTVYYRLKQTDFNGAFTYSYILPVTIGGSNDLQISNIINENRSISFIYNNDGGKTQIQLLDISGRVVKTQEVSAEGSQLVRFYMSGLSHGVYILHLTLNDQTLVKKVIY